MAENERTTQARDNDDSALIDDAAELPTPGHSNASGGHLARDVTSRNEEEQVGDPEHRARPTKQDDIDNDAAYDSDRR